MFGQDKKPASVSGVEMMMRSFGLGEIIDMAKQFANDGTFNKIVEFAEKADDIKRAVMRVEEKLDALIQQEAARANISHADEIGLRGAGIAPGAGAADSEGTGGFVAELPKPNGHAGNGTGNFASSDAVDVRS